MLIIAGKMRGCTSIKACYRFGKRLTRKQRERLGLRRGVAPCHSTMTVALGAMDISSLERVLTGHHGDVPASTSVAVDGKHLCGSADGDKRAVHLLAAYASTLNATLAQQAVAEGGNEITAMLDFLESFDVSGLVITGDAIFAQQAICQKVTDKGGNFVFTVKDNQAALKGRIKAATEAAQLALSPSGTDGNSRGNAA